MGIVNEGPEWSKMAVIVCTKCQKLFKNKNLKMEGDVADRIKSEYKSRLKKDDLMSAAR